MYVLMKFKFVLYEFECIFMYIICVNGMMTYIRKALLVVRAQSMSVICSSRAHYYYLCFVRVSDASCEITSVWHI